MCWRGHSFLCLRRGVSHCFDAAAYAAGFSLPTQRCFLTQPLVEAQKTLFSAYAEVFLREDAEGNSRRPFLCLRRGVSPCRPSLWESLPLFSAYAEVFLTLPESGEPLFAFLCLRRGVSFSWIICSRFSGFSLPTQRCFHRQLSPSRGSSLFSAYAEVFLSS